MGLFGCLVHIEKPDTGYSFCQYHYRPKRTEFVALAKQLDLHLKNNTKVFQFNIVKKCPRSEFVVGTE